MAKYVGQEFTCDYKEKKKFYKGICEKVVLHPHLATPTAKCKDPELGVFYVALPYDALSEVEEDSKVKIDSTKQPTLEVVIVPRDYAGGKALDKSGKSVEGEIREDNVF